MCGWDVCAPDCKCLAARTACGTAQPHIPDLTDPTCLPRNPCTEAVPPPTHPNRSTRGHLSQTFARPNLSTQNVNPVHSTSPPRSLHPHRLRPAQVSSQFAEKSVQIMHETSGGVIKSRDQDVVNRWGKVEAPPKEWLFMGGETGGRAALEDGEAASHRLNAVAGGRRAVGAAGVAGTAGVGRSAAALGAAVRGTRAVGQRAVGTVGGGGAGSSSPGGAAGSGGPKPLSSGFRPVYD